MRRPVPILRSAPNILSGLRLLAAPFAAWMILNDHDTAALLVFAVCAASDGLDGWIARTYGCTSDFGAWLDPAADKLLMLLCYTALCAIGMTPLWLLGLVVPIRVSGPYDNPTYGTAYMRALGKGALKAVGGVVEGVGNAITGRKGKDGKRTGGLLEGVKKLF